MRPFTFLCLLSLTLFSAACIEFIPGFSAISSDPKLHWRTLETEHFRIHFHDGEAPDAKRAAEICEEAHATLSRELHWEPWGKVHVVLADAKDVPDAKAVQFPYPQLLIFMARPGVTDALSSYDDWLRMVIFHEYTHLLAMDSVGGFWHGMRYVLGRVIVPGAVVPGWMSEGYAVFQESNKGKAGRVRSNYVDMVLRMDVLEDHWLPIDQLIVDSGYWPFGSQAYFYGGRFYSWLAEKHPMEQFGEYNRRYSSSFLNFVWINRHSKQLFGEGFLSLYREWHADLNTQYLEQKQKIETKGITPARRLTFDGASKIGLAYTPDGRGLLFSRKSGDERTKLLQISTQGTGEPKVVKVDFSATDLTWNGDRTRLFFSSLGKWRDYYEFYSLSQMFWKDHEIIPIRFKGGRDKPPYPFPRDPNADSRRFFNPHFSPTGDKMVFVGRDQGAEDLWVAEMTEGGAFTWDGEPLNLKRLTHMERGTELNHPRWSTDGKQIAVSMFDPKLQQRDLYLFSAEGELVSTLTNDLALDQTPVWAPDGRKLYFVSDRSGVFNVHVYDMEKQKIFQVTNVIGGAFVPTISPDGMRLAFVGYHAHGFEVYEMPLDPHTFFITAEQDSDLIDPSNDEVLEDSVKYQPWPEIFLPRFLSPEVLIVDVDDFRLGATIGASDALRRHIWSLNANYRTQIGEPGGAFSYTYARWYPKLFTSISAVPIARSGTLFVQSPLTGNIFAINGRFDEGLLVQRDITAMLGASMKFPIRQAPGLSWVPGTHIISAAYEYVWRRNVSQINPLFVQFTGAPFPTQVFIPTEYDASGIALTYAYDSTLSTPRGISPTGEINTWRDWIRGYSLALSYEYFNEFLGGNWDQQVLTADFRQYRRIPFTYHHVLALRAAFGFTFGQDTNPETFNLGGAFSEGAVNLTTRNFYPLRGFGGGVAQGEQMFLFSGEYRFPIWLVERGIADFPVYLKALHGAFFLDYGDARDRFFFPNDPLDFTDGFMSAGAELRTDFTFLYNLPGFARLGYGFPLAAPSNSSFNNLPDFGNGELILNFGTTF